MRLLPSLLLMLPAVVQAQFSYGPLLYSTSNETVTIIGYQGIGSPGGNLIIPDTIEGLPVTTIGYAAIRHTSLASITIPASVTSIGDIALDWNLGLTSVYFEGNAPSIGVDVFDFDPVTVYYLPETLGWGSTFGGVPAVVNPACEFDYTTNNGTITITGYSGSGGAVTIPGEINNLPVTGIGMRAFEGCGLTSVTMGNSVTSIGDQAFYGCDGLSSIIIPNSVTNLGGEAFCDCTSLTSVTIGSSVTSIGGSAFSLCTSLTTVYFRGNAPSCDMSVFEWYTPPSGLHPNPYTWDPATIYYVPGTTGWSTNFAGLPTMLWNAHAQPGSFGFYSNQFGFNITGSSNLVVVIEASTNLGDPNWSPLQTITLSGTPFYFTDPQWTNYPSRFYRVTWP